MQQIQATAGGAPVELRIEVSKPEAPWLRVTSNSKATPATVTFDVDPRSMKQGRYARHVRLVGPVGQTKTILVVFTVLFPGDGVFNTATSLRTEVTAFGGNLVGRDLAPQNLGVTHPGGRVPFTVQVDQYTPGVSWLRVAPAAGETPGPSW